MGRSQRRFRLTLRGGGQILVSELFKRFGGRGDSNIRLHPTTAACHRGRRQTGCGASPASSTASGCEMTPKAVLFVPGTPQSIADRVTATFRLLTRRQWDRNVRSSIPIADNFMALLDRSEQCCVCGRDTA